MATANQLAALLATALVCAPALCRAQTPQVPPAKPAPCTTSNQTTPCTPAAKPADEKFPFPGETPDVPIAPVPGAPASMPPDASPAPKPPAADADKFPFPDDPTSAPPPESSSSSSSSSSGDNPTPADPDDKAAENPTPGRHLLHRVNPIGTKLQTDDEREAEDLDVAHFYTDRGNLQGALLRTQDAVKTKPDDPDAHFALAEAALKLNQRDLAIAEYNACLKLSPGAKEAAAAHKALARLAKP